MISWLKSLPEAERKKVVRSAFNKVAETDEGKIVFAFMLDGLYFLDRTETAEQQALNNYAKFMLTMFDPDVIYRVADALVAPDHAALVKGERNGD